MADAFLLRFQEDCVPSNVAVSCGTKTETKTVGEGGDADPQTTGGAIIPLIVSVGTQTKTAVSGEFIDADPSEQSMRAITRLLS